MLYNYVKKVNNTFEFVPDEGHIYGDVVYNMQVLEAMSAVELFAIGLKRTALLPNLPNSLDCDGTYYFNELAEVVEYRPNYTIGIRVPQTLTPQQFHRGLYQDGLYDTVLTLVTQNFDYKLYFDKALEFDRNHPLLVTMAKTGLNMSDADIDAKFIAWSVL